MNGAPINRDASPGSARTYTPAMLARALGAGKARESVTAPQPDVEPVIRLAVEDYKPIMNDELVTSARCPHCRAHLRIRVKNPVAGPMSTTCSSCCYPFRFLVPLSALLNFDSKQRELAEARRAKVSNLYGY
jgi:hypothetical protein